MRRVILAIVSTVVGLVLLLTFKTHSTSGAGSPPAAIGTPSAGGVSGSGGASGSGGSGGGSDAGAGTGTAGAKTVTGMAANTIYGPVQVQIMVRGGKVTAAKAVEYPQGTPRDSQINAYAIPVLDREAASVGSAKIDMVSGATYTSQGYLTSLQNALDQAKIGA
jgi:FMN-binding domain